MLLFLHGKCFGQLFTSTYLSGYVTTYFVSTIYVVLPDLFRINFFTYFVLPTYFVIKLPYFVLLGRLILYYKDRKYADYTKQCSVHIFAYIYLRQ